MVATVSRAGSGALMPQTIQVRADASMAWRMALTVSSFTTGLCGGRSQRP